VSMNICERPYRIYHHFGNNPRRVSENSKMSSKNKRGKEKKPKWKKKKCDDSTALLRKFGFKGTNMMEIRWGEGKNRYS